MSLILQVLFFFSCPDPFFFPPVVCGFLAVFLQFWATLTGLQSADHVQGAHQLVHLWYGMTDMLTCTIQPANGKQKGDLDTSRLAFPPWPKQATFSSPSAFFGQILQGLYTLYG